MPERATEEPTVKSPVIQLKSEPLAIPVQDAPDATLAPVKTVAVGAVAWPSVVLEVGRRAELKVVDALVNPAPLRPWVDPPGFSFEVTAALFLHPKLLMWVDGESPYASGKTVLGDDGVALNWSYVPPKIHHVRLLWLRQPA